jgi:hypothetical protein
MTVRAPGCPATSVARRHPVKTPFNGTRTGMIGAICPGAMPHLQTWCHGRHAPNQSIRTDHSSTLLVLSHGMMISIVKYSEVIRPHGILHWDTTQ